ncbi:MAG: ParA family protein [Pseudomonadota bacterium]
MKVISLVSQKGGVGKTTLATALAVEATRRGQSALLLDIDPQASASFWMDNREDKQLAVTATPASRLRHVLAAAGDAGADYVFIDTPPFAKDIAFEAASVADMVLIPAKPAVLDIVAMSKTVELIQTLAKPAAVVLTFCPPAGRELAEAAEAVDGLGATLAPVRIGSRIAFSRAQQSGLTAQELQPSGKAAEEIESLYDYMRIHL